MSNRKVIAADCIILNEKTSIARKLKYSKGRSPNTNRKERRSSK